MAPPRSIVIDSYVVLPTVTANETAVVDARSTTTAHEGKYSFFDVLSVDAFMTVPRRTRFVVGEGTGKHPGTRAIESYLQALRQPRCVREALVTVCDGIPQAVEAFMRDFGPPGFRTADHLIATPQQWTDHLVRLANAMHGKLHVVGLHARVRSEIGHALNGQIAMLQQHVEAKQPLSPPEAWRLARLAELATN